MRHFESDTTQKPNV